MRYALISDIHANLPALEAVLRDIAARENVAATYHLGDLVGYAVLAGASVSASVLDPVSMLVVPMSIGAVALLAAAVSARKAALTDPANVLRDA